MLFFNDYYTAVSEFHKVPVWFAQFLLTKCNLYLTWKYVYISLEWNIKKKKRARILYFVMQDCKAFPESDGLNDSYTKCLCLVPKSSGGNYERKTSQTFMLGGQGKSHIFILSNSACWASLSLLLAPNILISKMKC